MSSKLPIIKASQGFTLIEVMVTVFVMAVGILGVAGMQAIAVKESVSLVARTEADFLVADMVDNMYANRVAARGSVYDAIDTSGAVATTVNCPCTEAQIAGNDVARWSTALTNSSLSSPIGQVNLIGIIRNSDNEPTGAVYQVRIFWDEDRNGATGTGCDPNNSNDMACTTLVVQI